MDIDPMKMAYARLAQHAAIRGHLSDPNVSLIDIGLRRRKGELENELAIRFHVRRKLSKIELQSASEQGYTRPMPRAITIGKETVTTDVIKGDYQQELWRWGGNRPRPPRNNNAKRTDPLCGGLSISDPFRTTYGTLGGCVIDRTTGEVLILSNYHVLAIDLTTRAGLSIYQPGRMDGGGANDRIAALARHAMSVNIDAAVATLNSDGRPMINHQIGLGSVTGVANPQIGSQVVKSGATTQVTYGLVTGVEGVSEPIRYGNFRRIITHVMRIEPQQIEDRVSAGGDSGSWWLDQATRQAVGLHFAGQFQPDTALAINMVVVLDALNVDIDTSRPAPAPRFGSALPRFQPIPNIAQPELEEVPI
jgi:endonuclease G, mitochondrial